MILELTLILCQVGPMCATPTRTPTRTATPYVPTATPTPPEPTVTPTPYEPTATPTPPICVPQECGFRCGQVSDLCGGMIWCGNCPPPPPPPGDTPVPECDQCVFPVNLSILQRNTTDGWVSEVFYFSRAKVIRQIVLEMDSFEEYTIYSGAQDPNDPSNRVIFKARGPRTVTIPWPLAGLPAVQWTHLGFYGGEGRMTIWLADKNHISIKQEILNATIIP